MPDTTDKTVIDKRNFQRIISKNIFISIGSKVFGLMVRFFMPPLILTFIDLEKYGIWAICFTIIGYLNLGAFGVANVYIRYVAEYHARQQTEKINGLLSTGVIIISLINTIMLGVLWFVLDSLVTDIFKIPPELHETAFILFYGTAFVFLIQQAFGAFQHMLNGLQKIAETTLIMGFCLVLETSLTVLLLFQGWGLYAMLTSLIIRYIVSIILCMILALKMVPDLSIHPKHFNLAYLKVFYRFGAIVQLSSMLGMLTNSMGRIIASTTLSMQATALLALGTRFPSMARSIPATTTAVYLPVMAYLYGQQRFEEMRDIYLQGSRLNTFISGFIMGYLAAFSSPLIAAWLGTQAQYQVAALIMTIFTLPQHLHTLTGQGSVFFKGIDKPVNNLVYSVSRLSFTLISLGILFYFFETTIINITIAVSIAIIISALIYIINNHRIIKLSFPNYIIKVLIPGFVPYVIAYLIAWLLTPWYAPVMLNRWYAAGFVIISGMLYSFITLGVIYGILLYPQERNYLYQLIVRKLTRLLKKIRVGKK